MCNQCQIICCQIFESPTASESQCTYFKDGKGCPKCANCPKSFHLRIDHSASAKEWSEMRNAFQNGQVQLSNSEQALNLLKGKMKGLSTELLELVKDVKNKLQLLNEIALKPDVFSDEDYFDQMINEEIDNKSPGWEKSVEGLKIMKERAANLALISKSQNVTDFFPSYKKLIDELAEN